MARQQGDFGALRERMAELTQTDASDWFLTFKARQAIRLALEAAATSGRREVSCQPFTCVTAVQAILGAGLRARYLDIDPDTLSLDASRPVANDDCAAVILQHTFGIMSAADEAIAAAARKAGSVLVEDCAHCVGRMARGADGRPLADVSVHSFGVEKMLPGVYFGGAVWVSPGLVGRVRDRLVDSLERLPPLDAASSRAARAYRNQMRVLTRLPEAASGRLWRRLEARGSFEPAVSQAERAGTCGRAPSLPYAWVADQALQALSGIEANERARTACVEAYLDAFGASGAYALGVPAAVLSASPAPLLRFPVFLDGRRQAERALREVASLGFYAQAWPRPLLLPGVLDEAAFGIDGGFGCPVSERLSDRVCALPTDIDAEGAREVAHAISRLIPQAGEARGDQYTR